MKVEGIAPAFSEPCELELELEVMHVVEEDLVLEDEESVHMVEDEEYIEDGVSVFVVDVLFVGGAGTAATIAVVEVIVLGDNVVTTDVLVEVVIGDPESPDVVSEVTSEVVVEEEGGGGTGVLVTFSGGGP